MTQIYPEKTVKWTNKGKNKSNEPNSQSHDKNLKERETQGKLAEFN